MSNRFWPEMADAIRGGLQRKGKPVNAEALYDVIYDRLPSPTGGDPLADLERTLDGRAGKPIIKLAVLAEALDLPLTELIVMRELGLARQKVASKASNAIERSIYAGVVERLQQQTFTALDAAPEAGHRSLLDWDAMRSDVRAVFVGDRRHARPSSAVDILSGEASPCDLQDILRLGLSTDARIFIDRIPILTPDAMRATLYDSDLLTIGSGRVNVVTMLCQGQSTFELAIDETLGEEVADYLEVLRNEFDTQRLLELSTSDEPPHHPTIELTTSVAALRKAFRERTFRDIFATDGVWHPRGSVGQHLGAVALAPHPWHPDRITVLVYGTSMTATYAGLVALIERGEDGRRLLGKRPLGGVYHVADNADRPPYLWSHGVRPQWLTDPYTIEQFEKQLDAEWVSAAYKASMLQLLGRLSRTTDEQT